MSVEKTFPISEIFGPTIQGEGDMIGKQTLFVRFAGCDYRCSWCDTKYSSYVEQIRKGKEAGDIERLNHFQIADACVELSSIKGMWVTFSGGNPALFNTIRVIHNLQAYGFRVAMETQGSAMPFPATITDVDHLIVSPKPPSSGMETNWKQLRDLTLTRGTKSMVLKIVVFDIPDMMFAVEVRKRFPQWMMYLSAGTPQDPIYQQSSAQLENVVLQRTRWLAEMVTGEFHDRLPNVAVLPQLHTLLWGIERGV